MIKSKSIPKSWCFTDLKNVGEIVTGNTPSMKFPHYYGGNIPWVKPPDINKNSIIYSTPETLSDDGVAKARLLPKGAVLVTCIGNIGNVALAGVPLTTNQQINSVVFNSQIIDFKYGFYWCKTLKRWLIENSTSTTISMINKSRFGNAPFLVAPLKEQKRIADKLDNLYHHLHTLNERLDRIPSMLKKFRENVLMQAVTGKMTEEWRENRKAKKGPANGSVPFRIPDIWQWHKLGLLTKRVSYGTSKKSDNEGKVPVLRMGNLQNGKVDWQDLKYSSDEKEIASYLLEPGDVLFNRTNSPELVGKTSIYEGEQPAIYAGYIIRVVTNEELNPYYLNFVLNSKYGRDWAWQIKSDGVSQSNINAKKLSAFEIPLPETDEQVEIVKQINGLFSIADKIEILYNELTTKLRKLPSTILGKAFAGQLVNQDPNDEPASLLLEKITQMKTK